MGYFVNFNTKSIKFLGIELATLAKHVILEVNHATAKSKTTFTPANHSSPGTDHGAA
jgi:hypothetical protein